MSLEIDFPALAKLDMRTYPMQTRVREKAIQASPALDIPRVYATNERAAALHPQTQSMTVSKIIDHPGADAKTFVLQKTDGSAAAWFRAGQYVSVCLSIGGSRLTRAYSLCESPGLSKQGIYAITVRNSVTDGFACDWILNAWHVGDQVLLSGPLGDSYYEPLRDRKRVLALAGGSGITPFLSMARAVADGIEDMDLTILFGSRSEDNILFRRELDELCARCSRINVVHVLSDEDRSGFEHGFLTAELIKKYGGEESSIFVCGPAAMFYYERGELKKLGLPARFIRNRLRGVTKTPWTEPGYPQECRGKMFELCVIRYGKTLTLNASANEPILVALERAGVSAPSHCRSGHCGWCRSKLCDGRVFIPGDNDGRRAADIEYGYIHPCSSFPISDMTIDIPGSEFDSL